MGRDFTNTVLATYGELCIEWRQEIRSFRSNGAEIHAKLSSLENVFRAFEIEVPGLVEPVPAVTTSEIRRPMKKAARSVHEPRPAKREKVEA